jgi:hypothetical protein
VGEAAAHDSIAIKASDVISGLSVNGGESSADQDLAVWAQRDCIHVEIRSRARIEGDVEPVVLGSCDVAALSDNGDACPNQEVPFHDA